MKLSTIQNTIRLTLVMLLSATVVVACGPEKHKHRMPMKVGQKGINPKTGLPYNQTSAEQQKKQAEALKNRSGTISEIDGAITQAKSGTPTDKNALKDGTYTLDNVITFYKYMNNSDDVRIYREHGIQNNQLTDTPNASKSIGFVATLNDTPRFVEVPMKMVVDRSQNQDWIAAGAAAFPAVMNLYSAVTQSKEMTLDLSDELRQPEASNRVKASVIDMLASAQLTNGAYSIKDENNKNVVMRLLKVSDTRLNIAFDIDEAGPKPLKARTIVLSYSVQAKAAAAAAPAAGQTGAQAPATTADGQLAAEQAPAGTAAPAVGAEQAAPANQGANGGMPSGMTIPGVDDDNVAH